jgi:hypothetical protein
MNEQKIKQNITKQKQKKHNKTTAVSNFQRFLSILSTNVYWSNKVYNSGKTDNAVNKSVLSSFSDIIK